MKHCVLSRKFDLMVGDYFYRVDDGFQGCTLQIKKKLGYVHGWKIYELRGYQNSPPIQSIVRLVEEWLEEANQRPIHRSRHDESLEVTYDSTPAPGFELDELQEEYLAYLERHQGAPAPINPVPADQYFGHDFGEFEAEEDDLEF